MLVRTVADGGEGYYVRGAHADTVPQLWNAYVEGAPPPVDGAGTGDRDG